MKRAVRLRKGAKVYERSSLQAEDGVAVGVVWEGVCCVAQKGGRAEIVT